MGAFPFLFNVVDMCRLFAQIAGAELDACGPLADSEFSLLKQGDFDPKNEQRDGWGLGWFENGTPRVEKSARPVFQEAARFRALAQEARSKIVIGHIRAASNPRQLDPKALLDAKNNQPFTDGTWLFAHNGTLEIPDEVEARLGTYRAKKVSQNDSEVYFLHWLKHYERADGDPARAFRDCIDEIWEIWNEGAAQDHPGKSTPYTSLNALASDGKRLLAFCHAARRGLAECGVCNPSLPWSQMSWSAREDRVLVASENTDRGSWERADPPELLVVDGPGSVRRQRLAGLPQMELAGGKG